VTVAPTGPHHRDAHPRSPESRFQSAPGRSGLACALARKHPPGVALPDDRMATNTIARSAGQVPAESWKQERALPWPKALQIAISAHAAHRIRIGPPAALSANSRSGSCKHVSSHGGIDTNAGASGVTGPSASMTQRDRICLRGAVRRRGPPPFGPTEGRVLATRTIASAFSSARRRRVQWATQRWPATAILLIRSGSARRVAKFANTRVRHAVRHPLCLEGATRLELGALAAHGHGCRPRRRVESEWRWAFRLRRSWWPE
jgi:hypothetical protein